MNEPLTNEVKEALNNTNREAPEEENETASAGIQELRDYLEKLKSGEDSQPNEEKSEPANPTG
jgi:hypothetical protein